MHGVNSNIVMCLSQTTGDAAQQAKLLYDISPLSTSTLISFNKDAEYLIEDKKSGLDTLLRVCKPSLRAESLQILNGLNDEIKWIKELEKQNPPFVLPEPVAGIDGNYVQKVFLSADTVCYCIMFDYLHGCSIAGHDLNLLTADFKKLGEMTAIMHQNVIQWDKAAALNRGVLDYSTLIGSQARFSLWNSGIFSGSKSPAMPNDLLLLLDQTGKIIKHRLSLFGKSKARFGLIHSNLTLSNIICYKNRFAITHFGSCGFGWFLYDFASSISFLEDKPYLPQLTAAWLEGYRRQRNISNEESVEIPTFVMMRRLELLNRLINHRDGSPPDSRYSEDFVEKTAALAENYLAKYS